MFTDVKILVYQELHQPLLINFLNHQDYMLKHCKMQTGYCRFCKLFLEVCFISHI